MRRQAEEEVRTQARARGLERACVCARRRAVELCGMRDGRVPVVHGWREQWARDVADAVRDRHEVEDSGGL